MVQSLCQSCNVVCLLPHCGFGEDTEKPEPHPEGPESSPQAAHPRFAESSGTVRRDGGEGSPPAFLGT